MNQLTHMLARGYPRNVHELGAKIGEPDLVDYIRRFLYDRENPESLIMGMDVSLDECPIWDEDSPVYARTLATTTFYAPSDISGIGGMRREQIRATLFWKKDGAPRHDCVFVVKDPSIQGFLGLHVARVYSFFEFTHLNESLPCALVDWFVPVGNAPCPLTGMWIVEPEICYGTPVRSIIHIDSIIRLCHLIGNYAHSKIPTYPVQLRHYDALNAFTSFYVNKFADHHTHEMLTTLDDDDEGGNGL